MPGTTRDAIEVEFQYKDRDYTLIDTAGLRRKGKVFEAIEKFSVIKTLQAIESSNVVVLLLDAHAGIAEQDANIAGYILESGRALVVGVNKWDSLDDYERRRVKEELERKLHFLRWAKIVYISALEKRGQRCPYRCVYEALYTEADTRFDRSHDSSAAAESRRRTSEDEICTPGRSESSRYRGSRKRASGCSGKLPSISGRPVQR